MIFIWPGMKLIKWLWIVNNNKYVQAVYLVGIKCVMDLLVTKVVKSIKLFIFKLMIIYITHRIVDAKLYDYRWNLLLYDIYGSPKGWLVVLIINEYNCRWFVYIISFIYIPKGQR